MSIAAFEHSWRLRDLGYASSSSDETSTTPVTFNYSPLAFKVKVSYTATFTYTPKDRSDAADYVIDEFERKLESDGNAGYGYQIAQGEQPDLNVTITVNSRRQQQQEHARPSQQRQQQCADGNMLGW